jgi:hypothetical protein
MDILKNLRGIERERETTQLEKCTLDSLLNKGNRIAARYKDRRIDEDNVDEYYNKIYADLQAENIPFTQNDLINFIHACSNGDSSVPLGLFTGCMLHDLTFRNKDVGKRTKMHIDGHGNRFDFLFLHCRQIDELVVENFNSWGLCNEIQNGNLLCLANNNGEHIGDDAASGGYIGTFILAHNKGRFVGFSIASEGSIGHAMIFNNRIEYISDFYGMPKQISVMCVMYNNTARGLLNNMPKSHEHYIAVMADYMNRGCFEDSPLENILPSIIAVVGENANKPEEYPIGRFISNSMLKSDYPQVTQLADEMTGITDPRKFIDTSQRIFEMVIQK